MKLRELDTHQPAPSSPAGIPAALAHTLRRPPAEAVGALAALLGLTESDTSRRRLSACDRLVLLAPRSNKMRRNVEAWLVAFTHGDDVLLLTAPPSEESVRHVHVFPQPCRRWVEEFGIIRSPALGLTGMLAPGAVESARKYLSGSLSADDLVPFFQLGNGDWDLFTDDHGRVGCYLHEDAKVVPLTDSFGRWFELRYGDCLA